jgi:hypothetical protein
MNAFWGNFDGCGYTISGLYTNKPDTQQMGLFAKFAGKEFKNVKLVNSYFLGDSRCGSLIAFVANGNTADRDTLIENVYSEAIMVADAGDKDIRSGGLFGMFRQCENVTVKNAEFAGVISGFGGNATQNAMLIGGIVGVICGEDAEEKYTFENCAMTGSLYIYNTQKTTADGERRTGGFMGAGYKFYGTFKNCKVELADTNITEANGFTVNRLGAFVGYYENVGDYTYEGCSFAQVGLFTKGLDNANGCSTPDTCKINGKTGTEWKTATDDIATVIAPVTPPSTDTEPPTSDTEPTTTPTVTEPVTTPTVTDPVTTPTVTEPVTTPAETEPVTTPVETEPTVDPTEPADPTDPVEPAVTTPQATQPQGTTPTTTPVDEGCGGCGGFAAIASVLALVAITGAAVVIKKKN